MPPFQRFYWVTVHMRKSVNWKLINIPLLDMSLWNFFGPVNSFASWSERNEIVPRFITRSWLWLEEGWVLPLSSFIIVYSIPLMLIFMYINIKNSASLGRARKQAFQSKVYHRCIWHMWQIQFYLLFWQGHSQHFIVIFRRPKIHQNACIPRIQK